MDKKKTVIEGSKSVPFNLADLQEEPEPVRAFPYIPSAVSLVGQDSECTEDEECLKEGGGNDTVCLYYPVLLPNSLNCSQYKNNDQFIFVFGTSYLTFFGVTKMINVVQSL